MQTMGIRTAAASLGLATLLLTAKGCSDGGDPTQPPPPPQPDRTLTVLVSGAGKGAVTSQPAGIDCREDGGTCSATFAHGAAVALTGTPGERMAFGGWSQACSGTGPCAITMDADRTVGAAFDNPHRVAMEIGAAGGEITSSDGRLTLTFPAAALAATQTITIEGIEPPEFGADFEDLDVGPAYELGPDGLAFAVPVMAEFRSDQAPVVDADSMSAALELLVTIEDGEPVPLGETEMVVDVNARVVRVHAELEHFSSIFLSRMQNVEGTRADVNVQILAPQGEIYVGKTEQVWFVVEPIFAVFVAASVRDDSETFAPVAAIDFEIPRSGPNRADSLVPYKCYRVDDAVFRVAVKVIVRARDAAPKPWSGNTTVNLSRELNCIVNPHRLSPGTQPAPRQAWRAQHVPSHFGRSPGSNSVARSSSAADGAEIDIGLLALSGAATDEDGLFVLHDALEENVVLERRPGFYVWGTAGAVADAPGGNALALLAWSLNPRGLAVYTAAPGAPFGEAPDEFRTDLRIGDATHAGGGGPTDAIVFTSRDLGVGFLRYDAGLGRFATSTEVLPMSQFFGDRLWAYVDHADAPAVVLAGSSNSRLYFHPRGGGTPTLITAGLGTSPSGMRCLPPLCLIFDRTTSMPVFRFDGENPPTRGPDAALDFAPLEGALLRTGGGGIAALLIGGSGSTDLVTEVEFAGDGTVLRVVPMTVPAGCSGTRGGAVYVPDADGVAAVVTCLSSARFFIERSALFPPP